MFRDGLSVQEVAGRMRLKPTTIYEHLADFIRDHRPPSIERWVDPGTYDRVAGALRDDGHGRLKPVFDRLGGDVSYDIIRLVARHREAVASE